MPRNGFALSKHSRRKDVANVTQMSKKCGERSRVLQDKHHAKISSYVKKYTLLGESQHSIHRGKSQFTDLTLLKLGVSEVVN